MFRKWLKSLKERRRQREFDRSFASAVENNWHGVSAMDPPADPKILRHISDEALHGWLGKPIAPESRIGLERELRRREAWSAPAGRAVKVSTWALVVAVLALIVSVVALWVRNSN